MLLLSNVGVKWHISATHFSAGKTRGHPEKGKWLLGRSEWHREPSKGYVLVTASLAFQTKEMWKIQQDQ